MNIEFLVTNIVPFFVSALVLYFLSKRVGDFIESKTDHIRMSEDGAELWTSPELAGETIGLMESALFFVVIIAGFPVAIGGWLVFKVAAKWETWSHIVRLPELYKDVELESEAFKLRHRFSSWLHSRFIIGTLANIMVAAITAAIYWGLNEIGSSVFVASRWPIGGF